MKQFLKYTSYLLFVISLLILTSCFIFTFFFSETIEKKVVDKIQQQMTTELQLGDVHFSFYETFPTTSVKITDLLALEKQGFNDDTLFYAKKTYIELNIFDIILNNINIKNVMVSVGQINIHYNEKNEPNFEIFKSSNNKNKIILNEINLINTTVRYKKNIINIDLTTSECLIEFNKNKTSINAKLLSKNLTVNELEYLNEKKINLNTKISYNQDSLFIHPSIVKIEELELKLFGVIKEGNIISLKFSSDSQKISDVINNTPTHLSSVYKSFDSQGLLTCDGRIEGIINRTSNPSLHINYLIKEGSFKLSNNPFFLTDITLSGELNNGENRNFNSTNIVISQFDAKTDRGYINGDFSINNLNKYYLKANLLSSWRLSKINNYFEDSPFLNLKGKLKLNSKYSGYISFDEKFKDYFISANHNSIASFKKVSFKYKGFPLPFNLEEVNAEFDNNNINIKNSIFTIADSDMKFKGSVDQLISYIWNKKNEIIINGDLKSIYIKFDELLTIKNINSNYEDLNKTEQTILPKWIRLKLKSNIETLSFNNLIANKINGIINYKLLKLSVEKINLKTLNGSVDGNFKIYESKNNRIKLSSNLNLKKLNIRNTFLAFNNFNQDFITAKHIKGVGSAEIKMTAALSPKYILDEKSLTLRSHLIVEKGELIQFKPLESLSNYVELEDLKEVKFSTLENTIEIENKVITIPAMEIKSSALSVFLSGTHTFEQKINYRIKLLLSELISSKFRKKNTKVKQSEFGEIKDNGKIFNTIYFKMTGNSEDPNISFDGLRFREDVKKEIIKEKKTISTIIKEDILQTKEKQKIEQGQDLIIEWDDD